jgi:hypothetical protein
MSMNARECGTCALCCKVLGIDAIGKPRRQWCGNCRAGKGCTIYADRPDECRDFNCVYVTTKALGEHWFPARSKMIVCSDPATNRLEIHVDEGRENAWRAEPFYSEIKQWAQAAARNNGQILVCLPDRTIVILPHADVDLGRLEEDDRILCLETMTPNGPVPEVRKVKASDTGLYS